MLIRRQSARVKKSGRFSKIGGLLASVPSISRPNFRAACLRKIVWELFFRTGTLATQSNSHSFKGYFLPTLVNTWLFVLCIIYVVSISQVFYWYLKTVSFHCLGTERKKNTVENLSKCYYCYYLPWY